MKEIYFVCTVVSSVGYGNNSSLPDIDMGHKDFTLVTLLMLFGLIIFQFCQSAISVLITEIQSYGMEVNPQIKLDQLNDELDRLFLQINKTNDTC